MKLKKWELALICALVFTLLYGSAMAKEQEDLSEKLIRLHVVANSDSDEDQTLKLKVRDAVFERMTKLLGGVADRDEAVRLVEVNLDTIIAESKRVLNEQGCRHDVAAEISVEDFPTRKYDTFSLPAGKYVSLRVVIGDGGGKNWWCVIFPPLCMTAATNSREVFDQLTDEQIKLITSDAPEYVIKFKSIEWLNKIKEWLGLK